MTPIDSVFGRLPLPVDKPGAQCVENLASGGHLDRGQVKVLERSEVSTNVAGPGGMKGGIQAACWQKTIQARKVCRASGVKRLDNGL